MISHTLRSISPLPSNTPPPSKIPTIRLIHATPSNASLNPNETLLTPNSPERTFISSQRSSQHKSIIPRKSKLGLLSGSRRNDDFSDITRRLGLPPASRGTEIYVDPSNDPDIGEIVVVRKEKARGRLESIRWALGDKTNSASHSSDEREKSKKVKKKEKENSKPKGEEKDRWWTIGRGRKDSKESKSKGRPKCEICSFWL
jgi:serine/arginine repetitive matrix protein 2